MRPAFRDRIDAGQQLAAQLRAYAGRPDLLVLALPRGGVPVGYAVAQAIDAALDVFLVRKLGVPGHEELAMGAIASGGVVVRNRGLIADLGIPDHVVEAVVAREQRELLRRERAYRDDRPPPDVRGRTVIVVDDGLATGATMLAAVQALREQRPAGIVVAVPVAARETCEGLRPHVVDVVCAITPEPFRAVGLWYEDFSQTSDDEVRSLLTQAAGLPQLRAREQGAPDIHKRGERRTPMEQPKLTAERAEQIINLLRDNPGVSMTLGDISDALGVPVEDVAAFTEELVARGHLEQETTSDGFDVFRFPTIRQRGTAAPPNS
jgi:putative phosphoribosyl transferase